MKISVSKTMLGAAALTATQLTLAGTDVFFNPLTHSASVASPNHINELNTPWVVPAGISQTNLTSLSKIEADINQSVVRVPAGTQASMIDMMAFDPTGRYIFFPHETPFGAGVSRYDTKTDTNHVLFQGDLGGAQGDWSNDYGAFDPARWTPNNTVIVGEEWTAEGRIIEILNPLAAPEDIEIRELDSIANVAHEGISFSEDERSMYYVDEWNSGSIYKFVMKKKGDFTRGQTFVLSVDAFNGDPAANWDDDINANAIRTGIATWIPISDKKGKPLTSIDPFRNGPTTDPRTDANARGGRGAADEVGATPYGRPEDTEMGKLRNGNEVLYVAITSEQSVYSFEMLNDHKVMVRVMLSESETPKNLGFPATTGTLSSPDNLAQDALGNIYVIEDAPNGSNIGGDIWFARDTDNDGVAESLDHFMSIQVDGSEATGMIFNPSKPTQFVVAVQHPDSTDLARVPDGFGDAVWQFDLSDVVPPSCDDRRPRWRDFIWNYEHHMVESTCSDTEDFTFVKLLERAGEEDKRRGKHWKRWK